MTDLPNRKKENPFKISSELEIPEKHVRSDAYEILNFKRMSTSKSSLPHRVGQQQLTREQQQLSEQVPVKDTR